MAWCGEAWLGVAWRGVAWRGLAWRGVAWRGVAWRGVAIVIIYLIVMIVDKTINKGYHHEEKIQETLREQKMSGFIIFFGEEKFPMSRYFGCTN